MLVTSSLRKVTSERTERFDLHEEIDLSTGLSLKSLQDFKERFTKYISRAHVLEQCNAVFRKQLETLQRMEEVPSLEAAFREQIGLNQRRIRELSSDRVKLQRKLNDAERMLEDYNNKYIDECDHQQQLRRALDQLNREADTALLRNLEYQIQSQFLQDDINSTKERHKKNLAEIQTYLHILHQLNHTQLCVASVTGGVLEQEKRISQRQVPALQNQLEEYKNAICSLQSQKQQLQMETSALEQTVKTTQDSYDDEIQAYADCIEALRREMEEAERTLERYTDDCRQLAVYQTSLENELDRHKRIIETEDTRLSTAIIGTPITLFTTSFPCTQTSSVTSRGKDITQIIQDITCVKPRQKNLAKKGPQTKLEERAGREQGEGEESKAEEGDEEDRRQELLLPRRWGPLGDVPDGAYISRAFDSLRNMMRHRMRRYNRPEPIADIYTKGRYVLVSGESSYMDPCFYPSPASGGHIFVTIECGRMPYELYGHGASTRPYERPDPLPPSPPFSAEDEEKEEEKEDGVREPKVEKRTLTEEGSSERGSQNEGTGNSQSDTKDSDTSEDSGPDMTLSSNANKDPSPAPNPCQTSSPPNNNEEYLNDTSSCSTTSSTQKNEF
ncbi:filensin [Megalops cyprinoides]|uniref:filensin n=1 Tax=Megalops cyprinoides TaxID=118141 RepID=UPI001864FC0A|nr:filensin [Megalops cyprinoides]